MENLAQAFQSPLPRTKSFDGANAEDKENGLGNVGTPSSILRKKRAILGDLKSTSPIPRQKKARKSLAAPNRRVSFAPDRTLTAVQTYTRDEDYVSPSGGADDGVMQSPAETFGMSPSPGLKLPPRKSMSPMTAIHMDGNMAASPYGGSNPSPGSLGIPSPGASSINSENMDLTGATADFEALAREAGLGGLMGGQVAAAPQVPTLSELATAEAPVREAGEITRQLPSLSALANEYEAEEAEEPVREAGEITRQLPSLSALANEDEAEEAEEVEEPVREAGEITRQLPSLSALANEDEAEEAEEPVREAGEITRQLPSLSALANEDEEAEEPVREAGEITRQLPSLSALANEDEAEEAEEPVQEAGEITRQLPSLSALANEDEAEQAEDGSTPEMEMTQNLGRIIGTEYVVGQTPMNWEDRLTPSAGAGGSEGAASDAAAGQDDTATSILVPRNLSDFAGVSPAAEATGMQGEEEGEEEADVTLPADAEEAEEPEAFCAPVEEAVFEEAAPTPAPAPEAFSAPVEEAVFEEAAPTPAPAPSPAPEAFSAPVEEAVFEEAAPTPAPAPSPVEEAVAEEAVREEAVAEEAQAAPTRAPEAPAPIEEAVAEDYTMGYSSLLESGAHPAWGTQQAASRMSVAPGDGGMTVAIQSRLAAAGRTSWGVAPGRDSTMELDLTRAVAAGLGDDTFHHVFGASPAGGGGATPSAGPTPGSAGGRSSLNFGADTPNELLGEMSMDGLEEGPDVTVTSNMSMTIAGGRLSVGGAATPGGVGATPGGRAFVPWSAGGPTPLSSSATPISEIIKRTRRISRRCSVSAVPSPAPSAAPSAAPIQEEQAAEDEPVAEEPVAEEPVAEEPVAEADLAEAPAAPSSASPAVDSTEALDDDDIDAQLARFEAEIRGSSPPAAAGAGAEGTEDLDARLAALEREVSPLPADEEMVDAEEPSAAAVEEAAPTPEAFSAPVEEAVFEEAAPAPAPAPEAFSAPVEEAVFEEDAPAPKPEAAPVDEEAAPAPAPAPAPEAFPAPVEEEAAAEEVPAGFQGYKNEMFSPGQALVGAAAPMSFSDFLYAAEVTFLDHARRNTSIGFAGFMHAQPPASLDEALQVMCVTASDIKMFELGIGQMDEYVRKGRARVSAAEREVSEGNPPLFAAIQEARGDELAMIRDQVQALKATCRQQTKLRFKEWRAKLEGQNRQRLLHNHVLLEEDLEHLRGNMANLKEVAEGVRSFQAEARARAAGAAEAGAARARAREEAAALAREAEGKRQANAARRARVEEARAGLEAMRARRTALAEEQASLLSRCEAARDATTSGAPPSPAARAAAEDALENSELADIVAGLSGWQVLNTSQPEGTSQGVLELRMGPLFVATVELDGILAKGRVEVSPIAGCPPAMASLARRLAGARDGGVVDRWCVPTGGKVQELLQAAGNRAGRVGDLVAEAQRCAEGFPRLTAMEEAPGGEGLALTFTNYDARTQFTATMAVPPAYPFGPMGCSAEVRFAGGRGALRPGAVEAAVSGVQDGFGRLERVCHALSDLSQSS